MSKARMVRAALRKAMGGAGKTTAALGAIGGVSSAIGAGTGAMIGASSERSRGGDAGEGAREGARAGAKYGLVTVPSAVAGAATGVLPVAGMGVVAHVLGTGSAAGKKREARTAKLAKKIVALRNDGVSEAGIRAGLSGGARANEVEDAFKIANRMRDRAAAPKSRVGRTNNAAPVSAVKRTRTEP